MDYDFERMGWRQFEHMVQALALKSFGPDTKVYGDGRDGGRELTYDGPLDLPLDGPTMDGYVVVQVKHHTRLGDPAKNAAWLVGQIGEEVKKYLPDKDGKVKIEKTPEYLIFASNVNLSFDPVTGADLVVETAMVEHAKALGLKGYFVWHRDHIERLLDNATDIRSAYGAFITAGDVLSQLAASVGGALVNTATLLRVDAGRQTRAKQWVRFSDSGLEDDRKIPLRQVGIDLPALTTRLAPESEEMVEVEVAALEQLLALSDRKLDPDSRGDRPLGAVIVGGPGQGKSTLAQLLCQLYRSAILDVDDGPSLGPEIDRLVRNTSVALGKLNLAFPRYKRWPTFVDLSGFAEALAANPELSLSAHVAKGITAGASRMLPNQIDAWLTAWPWLLVLDGFDEVAGAEMRDRVTDAISDFIADSQARKADIFFVITTRPQGYRDEFGGYKPEELRLRSLNSVEAVMYGTRVSALVHRDDPDLAELVRSRLVTAASAGEAQFLMQSPLQITIMAALFERATKAPDTRYALFDAYYDTVYFRERTKSGMLGDLLSRFHDDIDYLHEQVALLLHIGAEHEGLAESTLPVDVLDRLLTKRLTEQEHEKEDIGKLVADLRVVADQRLVLLVELTPGRVGFDIRPIQEYMAARAICRGAPDVVLDRLEVIAPSAHWRNVFSLAAGRLFQQGDYLRDLLIARLTDLDLRDEFRQFLGTGERLAVELLADNWAKEVPRYRKTLLSQALRMVNRWPTREHGALAAAAEKEALVAPDRAQIVKRSLTLAFGSQGAPRVSAVLILRRWLRTSGSTGAMAKLLLDGDGTWKPSLGAPAPARAKIGGVLRSSIDHTNFGLADRILFDELCDALEADEVQINASISQIASFGSKSFQNIGDSVLRKNGILWRALSNTTICSEVVSMIESTNVDNGAVAIRLRELVSQYAERQIVPAEALTQDDALLEELSAIA